MNSFFFIMIEIKTPFHHSESTNIIKMIHPSGRSFWIKNWNISITIWFHFMQSNILHREHVSFFLMVHNSLDWRETHGSWLSEKESVRRWESCLGPTIQTVFSTGPRPQLKNRCNNTCGPSSPCETVTFHAVCNAGCQPPRPRVVRWVSNGCLPASLPAHLPGVPSWVSTPATSPLVCPQMGHMLCFTVEHLVLE